MGDLEAHELSRKTLGDAVPTLKQLATALDAMRIERDAALKDAAEWKSHWEMYANAWKRELRGRILNKRHLIDALVLTTRDLAVNYDKWAAETAAMQERTRLEGIAKTIGWPGDYEVLTAQSAPEPTERKAQDDK